MASTGEVACFGRTAEEAYYAAIQSVNGFRMPQTGQAILIDGDDLTDPASASDLASKMTALGYNVFMTAHAHPALKAALGAATLETTLNRRETQRQWQAAHIQLVVSLSGRRAGSVEDGGYVTRRMAVDLGIPLINHVQCAHLFADAVQSVGKCGPKVAVEPWSAFVTA
jgi:carbamoyl-phosphate synthase large subunit